MTYGQDFLDKISTIKSTDGNKAILDATKGTLTGSVIGMGIGLGIGYYRKYNLFVSAFLGLAIGGMVSKYFINKPY